MKHHTKKSGARLQTATLFAIWLLSFSAMAQTPGSLLEKAYKKHSFEALGQFFSSWNSHIQPVSDGELNSCNDTIRQAYKAFVVFYHPEDHGRLGGSEWGNDIYKDARYLLVQNSSIFTSQKRSITTNRTWTIIPCRISAKASRTIPRGNKC